MSNLHPEQRPDRNGRVVTRHVRSDAPTASTGRSVGVAAPRSAQASNDTALEQDFDTLAEYIANPSEADKTKAMQSLATQLGNEWRGPRSWANVMGVGTKMTEKARADYDRQQIDFINDNIETYRFTLEQTAQFESMNSAHARAYDAGIETDYDTYFDRIWSGEMNGFSEQKLRANLAGHKQSLEDLEAGRITPGKVVGGGYKNPKRVATEWLNKQIELGEEAIRTHGRSDSVNVSNAQYKYREDNSGV